MDSDSLKLTTYFGERQRSGGALVADALLGLFGRRELRMSVLLRGVEGFGSKHDLRTDRLLTLSEDLPVVAVAVDSRARITALLDEALALGRHGLVTLERAQLVDAPPVEGPLASSWSESTKLTVYVGRRHLIAGRPAFIAVCDLLFEHGLDGATVLLGVDGTAAGVRQRARFFDRNADVPMMIIAVGATAAIAGVLPALGARLPRPLVTLERVHVCKRDGAWLAAPPPAAGTDPSGLPVWQKLMVYTSTEARHRGAPLHTALVRALREGGARGATSLRGVWGFHAPRRPHGDRFLTLRRRVPVTTVVLDSPERIGISFEIIDALTREAGLVTSELVPAAAEFAHGQDPAGLRLARSR